MAVVRLATLPRGIPSACRHPRHSTGQVFYLWGYEDENDWVVGMFTGGPSAVQIMRRFESQFGAEEFLTGLQFKRS